MLRGRQGERREEERRSKATKKGRKRDGGK
jgi:hypothetical protein